MSIDIQGITKSAVNTSFDALRSISKMVTIEDSGAGTYNTTIGREDFIQPQRQTVRGIFMELTEQDTRYIATALPADSSEIEMTKLLLKNEDVSIDIGRHTTVVGSPPSISDTVWSVIKTRLDPTEVLLEVFLRRTL